jgi:putative membrane protein
MLDLILTIGHHLGVFGVAALLAAELVTLHAGIAGKRLDDLGRYDAGIGAASAAVLIFGFLRVFFGDIDSSFYLTNPVFWMKIGTFIVVGLLSIAPTAAIMRWRRAAKSDPAFTPPEGEIARARNFFRAEAGLFVLIPIFAAAMANGIGL